MNQDQEIISRYIGQPARLPAELRARIEREWGNQPVQLYALADLDAGAQAAASRGSRSAPGTSRWRGRPPKARGTCTPSSARASARSRKRPGLSANTLMLLERARRSAAGGRALHAAAARRVREHPVRARRGARGAHGRRRTTPTASTPTRWRARFATRRRWSRGGTRRSSCGCSATSRATAGSSRSGLTAAAVVTLASLVPPYLAGYLIDGVVRPAQAGDAGARRGGASIAWIAVGGDGGGVRRAADRGARAAAAHVGARRVGRARPARRAVRAHPAAEPVVLLAEEDGKPDHARDVGHRPALGVRRVRRGGRVAVARDAARAGHRAALARLAARAGDDAAGAGVLLDDLPARRVAERALHPRRGGSGRA